MTPGLHVFCDNKLPALSNSNIAGNTSFSSDYCVTLHKLVSAEGAHYPENTPNHLGAKIPLRHTRLNMDKWGYHLVGYQHLEICAHYLENTPNHLGAKITLRHTRLNMDKWGYHLVGYQHLEICQYLRYGFTFGLDDNPEPKLEFTMRYHNAASQYYSLLAYGFELSDIVSPFTL